MVPQKGALKTRTATGRPACNKVNVNVKIKFVFVFVRVCPNAESLRVCFRRMKQQICIVWGMPGWTCYFAICYVHVMKVTMRQVGVHKLHGVQGYINMELILRST